MWLEVLNRAAGHHGRGEWAEAAAAAAEALAELERAHGKDHPLLAPCLNQLALTEAARGGFAEAEAHLRRSVAILEKAMPGTPVLAFTLSVFAHFLRDRGRHAEAEPLVRRVLTILEDAHGPDAPETLAHLLELARACEEQGRLEEAKFLYSRALKIKERASGKPPRSDN